jgi:tetratricopeptide (TPR) repeat protein
MQKIALAFALFFVFMQKKTFAQYSKYIDSLCRNCERASTDSDKVIGLGKLAEIYYLYKLDSLAYSTLRQQLLVAELSNNKNLIIAALFGDAITSIGPSATSESFDHNVQFIQEGIDYANENNLHDFIALGYSRMSQILRKRGELDKALSIAVLGLSVIQDVKSDSIKSLTYMELGNAYLAKEQAVYACRNYNSAFDIAVKINSIPLQSQIYHCISEMYKNLDYKDEAKNELKKSLALNKEYKLSEGITYDYYDLARLTDEKYFIESAIRFADSLHLYKYSIKAKRLMLAYYEVKEKNTDLAMYYLENEPDLKQSYINSGIENYYNAKGNIYFYSGNADSSLYYNQLAKTEIEKKSDKQTVLFIYEQLAASYVMKQNIDQAINHFMKAMALSKEMNDANHIANISAELSSLYEKKKDFRNAFMYSKQAVGYKDSLRSLSKEKDIALLGVVRENKKHEQELLILQKMDNARRNLQYMAITIAIVIAFFMMLFIGSFAISKMALRMMGYFFFISLFEFIVLLIDNLFLAHAVHNQPLKLWLIKIGLIGLLVPCQHFLERNVTQLLESKKLIEVRTRFSLKKWWEKMKKPSPQGEGLEEDTAVL